MSNLMIWSMMPFSIYHERHFDVVMQTFLKYKVTQDDIDRGRAKEEDGNISVTTTTVNSNVSGIIQLHSHIMKQETICRFLQQ